MKVMVCVLCIIFSSKTNKWKAIHTKVIRVSEGECVIFLLPKWSQNCVRSLNQFWSGIGIHHLLWDCSGSQNREDEITLCSYEEASLWTTGKLCQRCTHTHTHTHTHTCVYICINSYMYSYIHLSHSVVWLFETPRTVALQAPLSMGSSLEWVAIPFSRGSFQPRDRTQFCIPGKILYHLMSTPGFLPGESQEQSLIGCHLWSRTVRHGWSDLAAAAAWRKPL